MLLLFLLIFFLSCYRLLLEFSFKLIWMVDIIIYFILPVYAIIIFYIAATPFFLFLSHVIGCYQILFYIYMEAYLHVTPIVYYLFPPCRCYSFSFHIILTFFIFFFSVIGPELFLYLYGNLNLQFLRLVYIGMIPYSLLFFFILLFFLFILYFPAVIPLTSLLYNSSFFLSSTCTHPCVTFPHPSLLH